MSYSNHFQLFSFTLDILRFHPINVGLKAIHALNPRYLTIHHVLSSVYIFILTKDLQHLLIAQGYPYKILDLLKGPRALTLDQGILMSRLGVYRSNLN